MNIDEFLLVINLSQNSNNCCRECNEHLSKDINWSNHNIFLCDDCYYDKIGDNIEQYPLGIRSFC